LYALVALGLNLVCGTMRLLNVAHGEVLMVGSYVSFWACRLFGIGPLLSGAAAMLFGAALGAAVYFGLVRRSVRSATLAGRIEGNSLLLFFGVSVILQNVAALLFTASPRAYSYLGEVFHVGSASLAGRNLAAFSVAVVACGGATLFLRGSRTGLALRALIQHREAPAIVGIDIGRVQLISLCMGFAAAGLAGALVSMLEPTNPFMGGPFTMAAFVVIILGGLGNLTGSLAAGLLLGAVETYGVALTSPTYRSILIYGVFLGVLLLRPQGLFGPGRAAR
ncbi:MAG: branched-chain amino acid ABC transporter permease, partial [Deltaproteobacteria bacterium]|nr:branched-chain amino acid ABC transporter permease [Deltaproteobacteria bacterium]